jgi:hypothetical protein
MGIGGYYLSGHQIECHITAGKLDLAKNVPPTTKSLAVKRQTHHASGTQGTPEDKKKAARSRKLSQPAVRL